MRGSLGRGKRSAMFFLFDPVFLPLSSTAEPGPRLLLLGKQKNQEHVPLSLNSNNQKSVDPDFVYDYMKNNTIFDLHNSSHRTKAEPNYHYF